MRLLQPWFWLAACISLSACKDDKPTPSPAPGSTTAAPSGQAAPGASAASTATPSAAASATTEDTAAARAPAPRGKVANTPAAHVHLPAGCDVLLHLDIAALLAQPAIKEQLAPQLKAAFKKPGPNQRDRGLPTFLHKAGIEPLRDLKTLALCVRAPLTKKPRFVSAMGGSLATNAVATSLVAASPRRFKLLQIGGVDVASTDGGKQLVGQASDGVIIGANDTAMFELGLASGDGAAQAKLPLDKTFSAVLSGATLKRAAEQRPNSPFAPHLGKATRALVVADLAGGKSEARFDMPDKVAAAELGGALKAALAALDKPAQAGQTPLLPALKGMLGNTEIRYEGNTVVVSLAHSKEALAALAKVMAGAMMSGPRLRAAPQRPPRAPGF